MKKVKEKFSINLVLCMLILAFFLGVIALIDATEIYVLLIKNSISFDVYFIHMVYVAILVVPTLTISIIIGKKCKEILS